MAARRDSLARYWQKRDFTRTPEPKGAPGKKPGRRYLIQKHAATRLHYDFRLELDGTLKSWAVTRGPSLDPHDRRLAVEVEDHPLEYGTFEGTIPKGQYGGGTVMLWDQGEWEPIGDPREGLKKGKLEFLLHGKRLKGEWTLVRMKAREKDKGRNNWLLIKRNDRQARPGEGDRLLEKHATSVVSGRRMEKIAAAQDRVWQSKLSRNKGIAGKSPHPPRSARHPLPRGEGKKLPGFIKPELATLTDRMPQGDNWLHEVKFDGYRALAYAEGGKARLLTRTGQDWTHKFKAVAESLAGIKARTAILDGEIVALNEAGHSSFKALQNALSEGRSQGLQYYVFDLLYLDGKDLRRHPLLERKKQLKALIGKSIGKRVFYSEHFTGRDDMLKRLCALDLEGVVSKRADAAYRSGRGKSWLKSKCSKRQEFVIGGFTLPTHKERGIGALLLGYYENGDLIYAGKVGTGFNSQTSRQIRNRLNALKRKTMAFASVSAAGRRGAQWVEPTLVCEVEFTEWTTDGHLRHPSFEGLREDKPAKNVKRDKLPPAGEKIQKEKPMVKKTVRNSKNAEVGGIAISHPDRVIYPGAHITKLELAQYYLAVAEHILPHVAGRPLSMVRCPEGTGKPCFFQRHIARGQSPHLHDTGVKVKGRNESYLMIKDAKGLVALAQWGVIELHPWGCLADKPDLPDRIIFDLDPGPDMPWKKVMAATREVRERMQEFGLKSFLKTTGGKGLHVTIPIEREFGWKTIKAFAKAIADSMQHDDPDIYIATSSKAARKGKIFVDYLRNDLTATSVAPFSARARDGAPVAMPLDWSDLKASLKPAAFTVETVPARLKRRKKDPWKEFFRTRQKLSARYLKALNIEPE